MYRQQGIRWFALLGLVLFYPPLAAEEYLYQVEVVVFEYVNANSAERVPTGEPRPQWNSALNLFNALPEEDSRFTPLPAGSYKMGGVYRVLRSSSAYRPILHLAWQQEGLPASRARPVYISSDNAQVEGQIKYEKLRYLYIDLDLIYPLDGDEGGYARIKERRRLKLNELNYFDNPVFGAIVQVTRAGG